MTPTRTLETPAHGWLAVGLLIAAAAQPASAQRQPMARRAVVAQEEARRALVGEALAGSELERRLSELCDGIGPRLSGTAAGRAAEDAAYVALRDAGLTGVRFEDFRLQLWRAGPFEATAVGPEGTRAIEAVPLFRSGSTGTEGIEAPLVDGEDCGRARIVRMGEETLRGRAVMCRGASPVAAGPHRLEQVAQLARAGAAAMVLVSDTPGLVRVGSVSMAGPALLPAVGVTPETGAWLRRRVAESPGSWKLHLLLRGEGVATRARNVTGFLPGQQREEEIILGAHLDSWSFGQGCGDNATGVAVLLEAARLLAGLAEDGWRPRRTVRFVLFMGEEQGLHGSRSWVEEHRGELDRIRAMVNLEMPADPEGFVNHGHDEAIELLDRTVRRLRGLGLGKIVDRVVLHSDHQPFLVEGIPTIGLLSRLGEERAEAWHTEADTLEKIEVAGLQRAVAAVAVLAYDLASEEELPLRRYGPDETRALLEAHGVDEDLR